MTLAANWQAPKKGCTHVWAFANMAWVRKVFRCVKCGGRTAVSP